MTAIPLVGGEVARASPPPRMRDTLVDRKRTSTLMTKPDLYTPAFGSTDAFTLGVEQELFLVDAAGRQRNAGAHVLEALPENARGEVSAEVHACQVELISGVCQSAEEALADLRALRDEVLG